MRTPAQVRYDRSPKGHATRAAAARRYRATPRGKVATKLAHDGWLARRIARACTLGTATDPFTIRFLTACREAERLEAERLDAARLDAERDQYSCYGPSVF